MKRLVSGSLRRCRRLLVYAVILKTLRAYRKTHVVARRNEAEYSGLLRRELKKVGITSVDFESDASGWWLVCSVGEDVVRMGIILSYSPLKPAWERPERILRMLHSRVVWVLLSRSTRMLEAYLNVNTPVLISVDGRELLRRCGPRLRRAHRCFALLQAYASPRNCLLMLDFSDMSEGVWYLLHAVSGRQEPP